MTSQGDETATGSSFDPLSMIEMWQDLHQLIEQWTAKYATPPDLAATALSEFAKPLSNHPPSKQQNLSIEHASLDQRAGEAINIELYVIASIITF